MMTTETMSLTALDDSNLVIASLSGDREAFGQIVARYQSLICSLAYSATGSLGTSEDLAQETFITAWRHLGHLRERDKLRPWLCGIARNRINNTLRREGREPLHAAGPLDEVRESAATEPLPHERAISQEEEAILWRSLERIPAHYREPLVLFYREHQSIESVAAALNLTEDAVKQRLSRGRKQLTAEVTTFVEGALARTNPGKAFTLGVLAALPVALTASARAATLGATAVKGAATAKAAAGLGGFAALLSPVLGLIAPQIQYRVFLAAATTDGERQQLKRHHRRLLGLIIGFAVLLIALNRFGGKLVHSHPQLFAGLLILLVLAFVIAAMRLGAWANQLHRNLCQKQDASDGNAAKSGWEYRSQFELLGLPFIHIRFDRSPARQPPVKAWIAAGDCAIGVLFAFGGLAVAPVSIGAAALGLFTVGGATIGIASIAGFACGAWAFGGFALGWQAFGGCAVALNAASGGLAIARDFALGGVAQAAQANTELARQFIHDHLIFRQTEILTHYLGWLNLLWLIPLTGWWRLVAKSGKQGTA